MFFKVSTIPDTPLTINKFFSIQCLQHFRSGFVFSSSLSEFQLLYGCCHFRQDENFIFTKSCCIACFSGCCSSEFNESSKYFLRRKKISFSSRRLFHLNPSWRLCAKTFSLKRRMICQNTYLSKAVKMFTDN